MVGILGEVETILDRINDDNRDLYEEANGGFLYETLNRIEDLNPVLITAFSSDYFGRRECEMLLSYYKGEVIYKLYNRPSALLIEGELMLRGTACAELDEDFLSSSFSALDSLIISPSLLSLDGTRERILKALENNKEKLKNILVPLDDPAAIFMLESLRDSLNEIKNSFSLFYFGDLLELENAKRISSDNIAMYLL